MYINCTFLIHTVGTLHVSVLKRVKFCAILLKSICIVCSIFTILFVKKHDLMSLILSLCIISHVWKHTQFVDLPTVLTTNKCNSTIHFTVSSSHAVQNRSQTAINVLTVTITTPICALTTHLAYDKLRHDSHKQSSILNKCTQCCCRNVTVAYQQCSEQMRRPDVFSCRLRAED